ncbi:GNAT family N-acetyltransferase [Pseudochrobactrum kiredjianiae]|uniref:GNAT family N-acetyltransferase n=1 Tax=Pseudochrobactrum kiredjianiae TaxID=386305 RepID=A0ABW3VC92_9HYPH|nr:GNAT family protein [Pseudochrobactrum kiredjianiae]MDM7851267.1 GNAT family protein [Pseudochrobactrum kiredjianiae]
MDIRPFHQDDAAHLCNWFASEAELIQWGGPLLKYPLCEPQIQQMHSETEGNKPQRLMFSAFYNQELVAHAQLVLDWQHGVARLGRVAVNPSYRGQRLTQPFLQQIIERLFDQQEFSRLELNVFTFNRVAIQAYRKLGFQLEGIRRSCLQVGNERWDTAIFGMLRSDIKTAESLRALAS